AFLEEAGAPQVYVPKPMLEEARDFIEAQRRAQRFDFAYELHGLDDGDRVEIEHERFVEAFRTTHYLPTNGFFVKERRQRLKDALVGLKGSEIKALRAKGEDVHQTVELPLFAYTSDTSPKLFDERPELLDSEILVTECSYIFGSLEYDPEDESKLGEKDTTHCHVRPLMRRLAGFKGKTLALCHLPITFQNIDIRAFLLPRIPAHLRDRVMVLPYQDEPCLSIPYEAPGNENAECPELLPWRELDGELWEVKERAPYFGGRKKQLIAEIQERLGDFRIAYEFEGAVIERDSALQLYEDAYYFFLKRQPELLDWLVQTAAEVYDTEPENVASGMDYGAQEPSKATHLQDIAIRRVLLRLGRSFEGADLLEIRGVRSRGYVLNPGVVPFHRPECIQQPEWKATWSVPGSVESFWQSNKVIVVPIKKPDPEPEELGGESEEISAREGRALGGDESGNVGME
ncbi:MAG: hypothetical protein P1V97_09445, partial [Planctomycetota bacterium]|nr:hypothetical protein [Planctomycetota bacterium]